MTERAFLDSESEKNRFYINLVRGLAIFLMLWGHVIQCCAQGTFDFYESPVFKTIYSFHMPLFMLVSGYLFFFSFQKRELKELILRRSKPLLWTIFACSAFNYAITTGVIEACFGHSLAPFFNGNLIFTECKSLWFLWSVLVASLGVAIICKNVKKVWLQLLLLLLWSVVVYMFPNAKNNLYVYPYFVIGFYYAAYGSKISRVVQTIVQWLSIPLFVAMLFFFKTKHYVYATKLFSIKDSFLESTGIYLFRFAIGLFGSIAVLSLVGWAFQKITLKRKCRLPLSYGLSKMGEKSLQIYALSISLLSFYLAFFYEKMIERFLHENLLARNMNLYHFVFTPIIAVAYSFGLYWLIRLFEKIKFSKVLFGK